MTVHTFHRPSVEEAKQDPHVQKVQGYSLETINLLNNPIHKQTSANATRIVNLLKDEEYSPAEMYMLCLQLAKSNNRNEDVQSLVADRIKGLIDFNAEYMYDFAGWITNYEKAMYESVVPNGVEQFEEYKSANEQTQSCLRMLAALVFQWYFYGLVMYQFGKWIEENGNNAVISSMKDDVESLCRFCGEGIA